MTAGVWGTATASSTRPRAINALTMQVEAPTCRPAVAREPAAAQVLVEAALAARAADRAVRRGEVAARAEAATRRAEAGPRRAEVAARLAGPAARLEELAARAGPAERRAGAAERQEEPAARRAGAGARAAARRVEATRNCAVPPASARRTPHLAARVRAVRHAPFPMQPRRARLPVNARWGPANRGLPPATAILKTAARRIFPSPHRAALARRCATRARRFARARTGRSNA
jgi:hypothetical protein